MGRDGYVRVVYPGFLFPFGHRCFLVKITEREIKHRDDPGRLPVAAVVHHRPAADPHAIRQGTDNPFRQVTISPLVTPDIDKPPEDERQPFVPTRFGVAVPVHANHGRSGRRDSQLGGAAGVRAGRQGRAADVRVQRGNASARYFPVRQIQGRGQTLAVATPVKAGDTSVEVAHLIFDGEIDRPTSRRGRS